SKPFGNRFHRVFRGASSLLLPFGSGHWQEKTGYRFNLWNVSILTEVLVCSQQLGKSFPFSPKVRDPVL
ncbi:MAG: hypothetical protein JSV40_05785, partial [Deltaproteobacteria bacterium]